MAFAIQTGTDTFSNPYGNRATVDITFPTAFPNTNISLSYSPALIGYQAGYQVTISHDPATLTVNGVTLTALVSPNSIGNSIVGDIDFTWLAVTGGSSGSGAPTYTASYVAADFTAGVLTILASEHGCGVGPFLIQFLDDSAPANPLTADYTVNGTNGTITITDPATTGYDFTIIMTALI